MGTELAALMPGIVAEIESILAADARAATISTDDVSSPVDFFDWLSRRLFKVCQQGCPERTFFIQFIFSGWRSRRLGCGPRRGRTLRTLSRH